MNSNIKISFYWLLLAISLIIQANVELMSKVFFSMNHTPAREGIPVMVHVLFLTTMIIPVIFCFLNTIIKHKIFSWFSLVYSSLLLIINVYHFIGDGVSDLDNLSKITILFFAIVVNLFLVFELFKTIKKPEKLNM